jgi:hypothetical protein
VVIIKGKTESQEQIDVVRALKKTKALFCAVPNGGYRQPGEARRLKAEGVAAGVPDLLIFDPVQHDGRRYVGVALEMKRAGGPGPRPAQRLWLEELRKRGWLCLVGFGAADALGKLRTCGVIS